MKTLSPSRLKQLISSVWNSLMIFVTRMIISPSTCHPANQVLSLSSSGKAGTFTFTCLPANWVLSLSHVFRQTGYFHFHMSSGKLGTFTFTCPPANWVSYMQQAGHFHILFLILIFDKLCTFLLKLCVHSHQLAAPHFGPERCKL